MTSIVSVKSWKRDMRKLGDAGKITNLILPNIDFKDVRRVPFSEIVPIDPSVVPDGPAFLYDLRRAAEVHKIVRRDVQEFIRPGTKILDICNRIEDGIVKTLGGKNDLSGGVAFPTGTSLNSVFAHDTANWNDTRVVGKDDICKIDMGVHVNGYIIDSAFSVAFNPEYGPLLDASREAVYTGIKLSGPDASIYDISGAIKEVIESYEVTIKGKVHRVRSVALLGGHNINRYEVHGDQLILCGPYESREYKESRMRVDTQYAIECFASTGTGIMKTISDKPSNHYMLNKDNDAKSTSKLKTVKSVEHWIRKNRSALAFCPRWLQKEFSGGVPFALNELARKFKPAIVNEYIVLEDTDPKALSSHYEHTIYVMEHGKEVLSYGDDY